MEKIDERAAFSERLRERLALYQMDLGPTALAREFNQRYAGRKISIYAARKWLMGEAIPAQEKLRVLADWLGVSPEWLRFGQSQSYRRDASVAPMALGEPSDVEMLLSKLARLSPENRALIMALVDKLLGGAKSA